jgi:hypothetical protein
LQQCPCIVIVCKGTHNHPPPPPERIPNAIKDDLQDIIKSAIEEDNFVTAGSITSGNFILIYLFLRFYLLNNEINFRKLIED